MADKVIRDVLPEGTEAGIVVFSSRASVMAPMRFITSLSDREALAQELPQLRNFGGSTAIGLGLLKAIEVPTRMKVRAPLFKAVVDLARPCVMHFNTDE